ncbi:MAG: hypothetical protein COV67_11975 [Nitrospinae bacterium CG11_big_fil_rev_8_21_14_0_20_56_8]|nr:MAG: hypothetical protein COV67_11975 [Nitrospinae bacterium CG11_big_fil_rev_8_21_14_0_20_56_8]
MNGLSGLQKDGLMLSRWVERLTDPYEVSLYVRSAQNDGHMVTRWVERLTDPYEVSLYARSAQKVWVYWMCRAGYAIRTWRRQFRLGIALWRGTCMHAKEIRLPGKFPS